MAELGIENTYPLKTRIDAVYRIKMLPAYNTHCLVINYYVHSSDICFKGVLFTVRNAIK
jgi:hypothetical protein